MDVRTANPLDGRWEYEAVAYRVYFWELMGGHTVSPAPVVWGSDEYELTDVRDVGEVLEWAKSNANGRGFTAYAVVDRGPNDHGLVQLFGVDPTIPHYSG